MSTDREALVACSINKNLMAVSFAKSSGWTDRLELFCANVGCGACGWRDLHWCLKISLHKRVRAVAPRCLAMLNGHVAARLARVTLQRVTSSRD